MNIRRLGSILVATLSVTTVGLVACGSSDSTPSGDGAGGSTTIPSGGSAGKTVTGGGTNTNGGSGTTGGSGQGGSGTTGGASNGGGKGGNVSTGAGNTGSAGKGGSGTTGGGTAGGGTGDDACAADQDTCVNCCQTAHMDGAQTFGSLTFTACGCTQDGGPAAPCADKCTDFCGGGTLMQGDDCFTCVSTLTGSPQCFADAETACQMDDECKAYDACFTTECTAPSGMCGISYSSADCQTCADGACCDAAEACVNDADCAACLVQNPDASCSSNALLTALNTCISGSCADKCSGGSDQGHQICDSGIVFQNDPDPTKDAQVAACTTCLGNDADCCAAYTACASDGPQGATCLDCLNGDPTAGACATDDAVQKIVQCETVTCKDACSSPTTEICDSGLVLSGDDDATKACAACLGAKQANGDDCCKAHTDCAADGTNGANCLNCIDSDDSNDPSTCGTDPVVAAVVACTNDCAAACGGGAGGAGGSGAGGSAGNGG